MARNDTYGKTTGKPRQHYRCAHLVKMIGTEAGTAGDTSWLDPGRDRRVSDTALWVRVEHWRAVEMFERVEQVIEFDWNAGSRNQDFADAYAEQFAAAGHPGNLERRLESLTRRSTRRKGSTPPGWGAPTVTAQPAGRSTTAAVVENIAEVDADGSPIWQSDPDPLPSSDQDQGGPQAQFVGALALGSDAG